MTDRLIKRFLMDVSQVIIGSKNSTAGKKIFINTNNTRRVNKMRIKQYEINFD